MKKGKKLYEGKAKTIYATSDKNLVIQYFKDDATAFNNQKKSIIEGKGVLNNRISEHILSNLSQIGIKNHLVKRLNMREQIIKLVEIIPIEFVVRNVATGSITKRLGIEDGTVLKEPLIEYCLKDDKLGDPLIAEEHIYAFDWATKKEIEKVKKMILRINDFMIGMFRGVGIKLIDFKLEFGRTKIDGRKEIIPIEFVVRNIATGSITKRLGIEDGTVLKEPLIEYCLKDDKLGDPLIAEEHIYAFDWATKKEIEKVKKMILRINDFMIGMFRGVGIKLIDFKLEFGRYKSNGKSEVILADEISPDTCRLWDSITDKKLDKDRFRKDLGDLIPAYTEVAKRLGILHEQSNVSAVNVTKLSSVKRKRK